ncbi:hypothetical protein A2U01_0072786, partial [Trifolium medium]|nr:hypothetical protein [Trifolium medium]
SGATQMGMLACHVWSDWYAAQRFDNNAEAQLEEVGAFATKLDSLYAPEQHGQEVCTPFLKPKH